MSDPLLIHGTAVAFGRHGALIVGASGTGKSSLALQLLALGCELVADDQVLLTVDDYGLTMSCPDALPAMIEARNVGLLPVRMANPARLVLCVDLDELETQRFPEERHRDFLGHAVKVIRKTETPHFPAAILLYLKDKAESQ